VDSTILRHERTASDGDDLSDSNSPLGRENIRYQVKNSSTNSIVRPRCSNKHKQRPAGLEIIQCDPSYICSASGRRTYGGETRDRWLSKLEQFLAKHHYRDLTMNANEQEDSYHKVACFQELVFMSLCAVASQTSENTASVYEAMRLYKNTNPREKHLKKLIRGAIWANRSIFALGFSRDYMGPGVLECILFWQV
jgi:hypothetical protein